VDDGEFSYRPQNFRVYEFDEIDGRSAEQLAQDIVPKIAKLNAIQSTDFSDAWRVLSLRQDRPGRAPARLNNETGALV
jgi:hypothetical protein